MHLTGGQQPTGAAQVDLVGAGGLPPSIGPPLDVAAGMAHGHRTSDIEHGASDEGCSRQLRCCVVC